MNKQSISLFLLLCSVSFSAHSSRIIGWLTSTSSQFNYYGTVMNGDVELKGAVRDDGWIFYEGVKITNAFPDPLTTGGYGRQFQVYRTNTPGETQLYMSSYSGYALGSQIYRGFFHIYALAGEFHRVFDDAYYSSIRTVSWDCWVYDAYGRMSNGPVISGTADAVYTPVPEPSTALLLIPGLFMLGLRRRRHK